MGIGHGNFHHALCQRENACQLQQVTEHAFLRHAAAGTVQVIVHPAVGNIQGICFSAGNVGVFGVQGSLVKGNLFAASGIPDTCQPLIPIECPPQTEPHLLVACRCINYRIGHRAEERHIVQSVVGFAVLADNAGTVDPQHHMHAANGNIVHQLVIGSLQKGRIHRKYRQFSHRSQCRGKSHGVLFGNAHIIVPVRELPCKMVQSCAPAHCCRYGTNAGVVFRQLHQFFAKHLRIGIRSGNLRIAGFNVKLGDSVILRRLCLCRCVALALDGMYMDKHRTVIFLCRQQHFFQFHQIVAVHRSQIDEAEILEDRCRLQQYVPYNALGILDDFRHRRTDHRGAVQAAFHRLFGTDVSFTAPHGGQVACQCPHVFGNGHLIVIEDHNEIIPRFSGIVQSFIGQPAGHGSVPYNGNGKMLLVPVQPHALCNAACHGDRSAAVPADEAVVF